MSKIVLLTGTTGFLGSNIARELIRRGYRVFGIHRESSSFERLKDVFDSLNWINIQNIDWIEDLKKEHFDILIHAAWEGVSVTARDDWEIQLKNFEFSKLIFNVALNCGVNKIVSLGSQAEYGTYSEKVSENYVPFPCDAYGAAKLLTLYYLKNFATKFSKEWYWIRVFSVFGRGENDSWVIPQVIKRLQNNETIELTEGKQVYDYLYADDFVTNFVKMLTCRSDKSGVYNLCSGIGIEIKSLLNQIAATFPNGQALLEFGKIPYRDNQNMYMVGNSDKFESTFGKMSKENLKFSINKTINFYQDKRL